jgi:hypothetical protein
MSNAFRSAAKIKSWFVEDEVLTALNLVPPKPSSYAAFLGKLSAATPDPPPKAKERAFLQKWVNSQRIAEDPHVGFLRNYLSKALSLELPPAPPGEGWRLPKTVSGREAKIMREALTLAHLRTYVDAWLDTGRRADGSESVGERNLTKAPTAHRALWDYLNNAPPTLRESMGDVEDHCETPSL